MGRQVGCRFMSWRSASPLSAPFTVPWVASPRTLGMCASPLKIAAATPGIVVMEGLSHAEASPRPTHHAAFANSRSYNSLGWLGWLGWSREAAASGANVRSMEQRVSLPFLRCCAKLEATGPITRPYQEVLQHKALDDTSTSFKLQMLLSNTRSHRARTHV